MESFHWSVHNLSLPARRALVGGSVFAIALLFAWAVRGPLARGDAAAGAPAAGAHDRTARTGAAAALPFSLAAPPPAFEGVVTERAPAGGYVYLRVDDRWVVSLHKPLAVGARVRVRPIGLASQFESARLKRSFSPLVFAVVSAADAPPT